jgi:hypothetical protein
MEMKDWLNLCDQYCSLIDELTQNGNKKSTEIDSLIMNISKVTTDQWIETHNTTLKQIDDGLKTQGKLINTQYNVIKKKNTGI